MSGNPSLHWQARSEGFVRSSIGDLQCSGTALDSICLRERIRRPIVENVGTTVVEAPKFNQRSHLGSESLILVLDGRICREQLA